MGLSVSESSTNPYCKTHDFPIPGMGFDGVWGDVFRSSPHFSWLAHEKQQAVSSLSVILDLVVRLLGHALDGFVYHFDTY